MNDGLAGVRPPPVETTRREAIATLSAATLLALGLWPGALRAGDKPPPGKFSFVVLNDTHYQSPECALWMERVAAAIRAESAAFCLLVGDLVEVGTRENHLAFRGCLERIGVPVYVVPGNHDWATQTDRSGFDDVHPGRSNYRFEHEGWQFVGLDSTDGVQWQNTSISDATLRWCDEELARVDRAQPMVLFTHFPLADGVKYQPVNAGVLLERFREHNVQAVFNGHFHGFTEKRHRSAPVTTNRCCGLKVGNHDGTVEKGFFVCTAQDGTVARRDVLVTQA